MKNTFLLAGVLALAACAPVQTLAPVGPGGGRYFGPGPYASWGQKSGDLIHFKGDSDPSMPLNYEVRDYKSWSDAGTFGRVLAWNRTDAPFCAQVRWGNPSANMSHSRGVVVVPPKAEAFVIAYWDTKYVEERILGYEHFRWRATYSGDLPTLQDCERSRPAGY